MFLKLLLLLLFAVSSVLSMVQNQVQRSELRRKPKSLISVNTSLGQLIGYRYNALNRTINVFYGVPYAEPPVNELRFKRSKLIERFPSDPYGALDYKPHCAQGKTARFHYDDKFEEDW